jgi:hypothetical protein
MPRERPLTDFYKEDIMEVKHVIILMFVVFLLFMLANWFNRRR